MRIAFVSEWTRTVIEHKSRNEANFVSNLVYVTSYWVWFYLFLQFDIGTAVIYATLTRRGILVLHGRSV